MSTVRRILIPALALLVVCGCVMIAVGGIVFLQKPATVPAVLIVTPANGARVEVNTAAAIHATARDDQKIRRVEVWIDGALFDAQSSTVATGISPFPLLADWRPSAPGAHAIVVRAFNTRGGHSQAAINVEAIAARADRDNDGIVDAEDACPDQPGLPASQGCPAPSAGDRDGDGIADAEDACPDQPGSAFTAGCPDADGDGVRDADDACPRERGAASNRGCPTPGDADGDGGIDAADDCPNEPGPAATRGCPDRDGDGVRDRDDACPDQPGSAALSGCPDRDGDGVRDLQDLCPDVPGPATNAGCPVSGAGDRDGDGVRDDVDLNPDIPGSGGDGGSPAPGGGGDADRDGTPDDEEPPTDPLDRFSGFFVPGVLTEFTTVEFQALEFHTAQGYDEGFCYFSLAGRAEERTDNFHLHGMRDWPIADYEYGIRSRMLMVPKNSTLAVRAECGATLAGTRTAPGGGIGEGGGSETYFDLGSIAQTHPLPSSAANDYTVTSTGGAAGHSFRVKYRVCSPACDTLLLEPPHIGLRTVYAQNEKFLDWFWRRDRSTINGFNLYRNGTLIHAFPADASSYALRSMLPPACGGQYDFQMTAYRGYFRRPERESPRSGTVTWRGEPCPRTVVVKFDTIRTGALPPDEFLTIWTGPLYGSFAVNGQRVAFDTMHAFLPSYTYNATWLTSHTTLTVELGAEEDLTIVVLIKDRDIGRNDTIFSRTLTIPAREIANREFTMTDGRITLTGQIQVR